MISNERKIGLIPRLWVQGKWGPQDYALLVTDQRTILVLEKSSKAGIGAAFGVVGALVASAATSRRTFDYNQMDPQALANDQKNTTIPHEALRAIQMKKKRIGPAYEVELQYTNSEGKNKTVKGALLPPGALVKTRKNEGTEKGQIFYDYARNLQAVYQNALGPARLQSIMTSPPI